MEKPMDYTYISIQSWMVSELDLKGNELMIYAIIYGFCQDRESRFKGGRSYLARWTNSTVRGVQKNLNSLVEKGLIAKEEKTVDGIKACDYYPINLPWERTNVREYKEENAGESGHGFSDGKEALQGSEQSSPHNIKSNIKGNIKSSSSDGGGDQLPFSTPEYTGGIEEVVRKWNGLQKYGIPPVSRISRSSKRYKMLNARLREYGLENVLCAVDNIAVSGFLQGKSRNGWMITFDWFVKPNNFPKVLEGNYGSFDAAGKDGGSYADAGRGSGQYTGRDCQKSGENQEAGKYNPADYFGSLMDS